MMYFYCYFYLNKIILKMSKIYVIAIEIQFTVPKDYRASFWKMAKTNIMPGP